MTKLTELSVENGAILVEVANAEVPTDYAVPTVSAEYPEGTEHITAADKVASSLSQAGGIISEAAKLVSAVSNDVKPSETMVELNIGFAGELGVPFLASGEANAGIKIKLTWRKDE